MKIIKKVLSALMVFLIIFPTLSQIAIYADDLSAADFSGTFESSQASGDTFNDFKYDSSDGSIKITYDGRTTDYEKEIKVTLPVGLDFDFTPDADGTDRTDVSQEVENGQNVLYITLPAMDSGISKTFSYGVDLDPDMFYSAQSFTISNEYYELDSNGDRDDSKPVKTYDMYLTAYDYSANGTINSTVLTDNENIFADNENKMQLTLSYNNDYKDLEGTYLNDDFSMYVSDFQIDLSQVLVDQGSGFVPLGSDYQYVSITDTEDYTYDSTTGILTFNDFVMNTASTVKRFTIDFYVNFDSSFFNPNDKFNWNLVDAATANYSENNLNDLGSAPHTSSNSGDLVFQNTDYIVDVQVWAQSNDTEVIDPSGIHSVKPDTELPLFKNYIDNFSHDITNLEYTMDIPAGMTINSVSAPEILSTSAQYGGTVTITDESGNQSVITAGNTQDLTDSIVGPTTVTVTVDSMEPTDRIDYLLYSNNRAKYGISFYGTMSGNEGDVSTVELDSSSITADTDGQTDVAFTDDDLSNNDIDLTLQNLQSPSMQVKTYQFWQDGSLTNAAQPNESVEVRTTYEIAEGSDISTYKVVKDPVVYVTIPQSLTAPGGSFDTSDIIVDVDGTDITSSVSSFTATDSTIMPGGTLLEIKLDGYTLNYPETLRVRVSTVVDPNITETVTETMVDGSSAFGTNNTDELNGIYPRTQVAIDETTLGVDVTGDQLAGTSGGTQLTINIPETIRALSSVDTTTNGFVSVNDMSEIQDYPEYYMGEDGVFNFSLQNTTMDDVQDLTGYYILPDDIYEGMQFVLDDSSVTYDTANYTYAFTNDEINDTTGWLTGDDSNVTWSTTLPSDGKVTAVRITANNLEAGDTYAIEIPFTTVYLTEDQYDQDRYNKKTDGELIYMAGVNNSSDGDKASITIVESEYPEITTNINESYTYSEINDLITDVQDYSVSDDYSELTDDINKDETTITGTDIQGNSVSYTYDEFINLTSIAFGSYTIHYKTENDADGHVTLKDVDFDVEQQTSISKNADDANGNGVAEKGETITYSIDVTNDNLSSPAVNVAVRDSMLENMPDYVTYNNDLAITGGTYTGDLASGDLVIDEIAANSSVTLTYSVTLDEIPSDGSDLVNVVTDNGEDPTETCDPSTEDCDSVTVPTNPETTITKTATDSDGNNVVEKGESVTYTIYVTNPSSKDALNVAVRDSMLENLPDYVTYNNDLTLSSGTYTGDLEGGDFVIDSIAAGTTTTLTYSVTLKELPEDNSPLINTVTDNGEDPTETCNPSTEDCDTVTVPTNPSTTILKSADDANGNGVAEVGETINYSIEVTNTSSTDQAINVAVRDSMLESTPSYATYNNDFAISSGTYTGDITLGDFVIDSIQADETIIITYSITIDSMPTLATEVINVATDNGSDPTDSCEEGSDDCSLVTVPINPATLISKTAADADGNGIVTEGESVTYTIDITNESTTIDSTDVAVRDSMLENLPDYVTYNNDLTISGGSYTGDLQTSDLVIDSVAAGSTVTLTYSITLDELPSDGSALVNVVTDNGSNPTNNCDPSTEDCDTVTVPTNQNTVITKSATDTDGNNIVEQGESVTYSIDVKNESLTDEAIDVAVRDSMLENLPGYVTYNDDLTISGGSYTGDLQTSDLVIDSVAAGSTVTLTYSITLDELPSDGSALVNVVTDNGSSPTETCDPSTEDCDTVSVPTNQNTVISKSATDTDGNNIVEQGESVTYSIDVKNESLTDEAINVAVRDSMLENLPGYVTYNNDLAISGATYTGDLQTSDLVIDSIAADSTVTLTYSITLDALPSDGSALVNVVTDNGSNPTETCDPSTEDCDTVTVPTNQNTVITKSATDTDGNNVVSEGESVTYSIDVKNESLTDEAINVAVRDSMLENLPGYVTYNNDLAISGGSYTGDLQTSDLVIDSIAAGSTVTLTYSITLDELPSDGSALVNVVTDNGSNPTETCDPSTEDCDTVTVPTNQETVITKSATDTDGNNIVEKGESVTYSIDVKNESSSYEAVNVAVRDSMLENLPGYVTYNDDLAISGATYTGDLVSGDLVIDSIASGSTVTLTYSITLDELPSDGSALVNVVTDNGSNPTEICDPSTEDCDTVTVPTNQNTVITKSAIDTDGNNIVEKGESVTYSIDVKNESLTDEAINVAVRDSMLENLPGYVTYNDDLTISSGTYTGDLVNGDLVIDSIAAGSTVTLTYSITLEELPSDGSALVNVVTDNGEDPTETCDPETEDCDSVTVPTNPKTSIVKSATDTNGNGIAEKGETITYSIDVTNESLTDEALNVAVRDSMLENLPSYVTYNNDLTVNGATYTGDLVTNDLVIDSVATDSTVTLTYSIYVNEMPSDSSPLINTATDNGSDPSETCDPETEDCSTVTIPTNAPTSINKEVTDENDDQLVSQGETLTYVIEVTNMSEDASATDISVRDSMLEDLPSYLTYNDDLVVDGANYSGSLTDANLVIDEIAASDTIYLTYSITVNEMSDDISQLINTATTEGQDPTDVCDPDNEKCSTVEIEVDPENGGEISTGSPDTTDENGENASIVSTGYAYYMSSIVLLMIVIISALIYRKVRY